jgi:hypothetical protein
MTQQKLSKKVRKKGGSIDVEPDLVVSIEKLVYAPIEVLDQVGQLRVADQQVLIEKYVRRRSASEIAQRLKVQSQTIKVRLKKAEERLSQALADLPAHDDIATQTQRATEWTNDKDARRCDLIDREIDGALTIGEQSELDQLQHEMLAYRRSVAPLPIGAARKLHAELMEGLEKQ